MTVQICVQILWFKLERIRNRNSGNKLGLVATTNSLSETTDESCPLIGGIPTIF